MAYRLIGVKPLSEPVVAYNLIWLLGTDLNEILIKIHFYYTKKWILECCLQNDGLFVGTSMC